MRLESGTDPRESSEGRPWAVRCLHVASRFDEEMGGSIRAALNVCKALVETGDKPECLGSTGPEDHLEYLAAEYPEIPIRLFPRRFPAHYSRSPQARRWLYDHIGGFDVLDVHGVFSFPPMYAALAARSRGVPYVIRPHGSLEPYDLQKHTRLKTVFGRLVLRRVLENAAAIVLTSELESRRLVSFGTHAPRVVIPLPVPAPSHKGDGRKFRLQHGLAQDATVVLFLGRIDEKKGLDVLIPAVEGVRAAGHDVRLVIAGAGDHRETHRIRGIIGEMSDRSWVAETGFLSGGEKQSALEAANIFALPSRNENFGIAVIEAMQCGVPVLVSNEVYIYDEVVRSGAGRMCEPTLSSCRAALEEMVLDTNSLCAMGAAGRRVARTVFSAEASTTALHELYKQVAERGGRTA